MRNKLVRCILIPIMMFSICVHAQTTTFNGFRENLRDYDYNSKCSVTYNFNANKGSLFYFTLTYESRTSLSGPGMAECLDVILDNDLVYRNNKIGSIATSSGNEYVICIPSDGEHLLEIKVSLVNISYDLIGSNIKLEETITNQKGLYFFKIDNALKLAYKSTFSNPDSIIIPAEVSIPFDGKYEIKEIGDSVFKGLDVKYISIPNTVKKNHENVAIDCSNLSRVDCEALYAPYVYPNSFPAKTNVHVYPESEWYDTYEWSCYNVIYDLGVVKDTAIYIDEYYSLEIGESKQLTAEILPSDAYDKSITWKSNAPGVVEVSQSGKITALDAGTAMVIASTCDGTNLSDTCFVLVYGGDDMVDLGLPSGNLWKLKDVATYIQWAALKSPSGSYKSAPYSSEDNITKYNDDRKSGNVDNKAILDLSDDLVHVTYGEGWHIPSVEDFKELYDNCSFRKLANDISIFISHNGTFIPFKMAGYRALTSVHETECGFYWTRELYCSSASFCFKINDTGEFIQQTRIAGCGIRGVKSSETTKTFKYEIDGLYYELDKEGEGATLVAKGNEKYSGKIILPASIEYEGRTYSVTSIGSYAFYGCTSLISITIPESVTSIGWRAFYYCSSLTSVSIPNSVTSIGGWAFNNCTGLRAVTIGRGIQTIYSSVFYDCTLLYDVYCYAEKVPTTIVNAFKRSSIKYATLHVPAASLEDYKSTEPWTYFGQIVALPDEETGIDNFKTDERVRKTLIYDLAGRRVQKPQKGLFIQNGKKVMVR